MRPSRSTASGPGRSYALQIRLLALRAPLPISERVSGPRLDARFCGPATLRHVPFSTETLRANVCELTASARPEESSTEHMQPQGFRIHSGTTLGSSSPAYPLSHMPAASSRGSGGGKMRRQRTTQPYSTKRPKEHE
ncbi:unnamed protein product, partial [Pleuronectes platessa]